MIIDVSLSGVEGYSLIEFNKFEEFHISKKVFQKNE